MKRLFLLLMVCVFSLGMVGCGSAPKPKDKQVTKEESSEKGSKQNKILADEDYEKLYSDADKFKDYEVDLCLKVFSVEKDNKGVYLQGYYDPDGLDKNTIVGIQELDFDIKNDDIIHVIGRVKGKFIGENAFGAKLTVPVILADTIEKTDYATAFAPPIMSINPENLEKDQYGYIIKIEKIDFAKNETRVYLNILNNTTNTINFYTFNAKAIQNDKQYDNETNYKANYQEPQSEILSGVKTEGIVTFPAIDIDAGELRLIFEGSSDNWDIRFQPFVFSITW